MILLNLAYLFLGAHYASAAPIAGWKLEAHLDAPGAPPVEITGALSGNRSKLHFKNPQIDADLISNLPSKTETDPPVTVVDHLHKKTTIIEVSKYRGIQQQLMKVFNPTGNQGPSAKELAKNSKDPKAEEKILALQKILSGQQIKPAEVKFTAGKTNVKQGEFKCNELKAPQQMHCVESWMDLKASESSFAALHSLVDRLNEFKPILSAAAPGMSAFLDLSSAWGGESAKKFNGFPVRSEIYQPNRTPTRLTVKSLVAVQLTDKDLNPPAEYAVNTVPATPKPANPSPGH